MGLASTFKLPSKLQDLPSIAAHFCLRLKRFMEQKQIPVKGRPVLVGFSGGADSTALLLAMHLLAPQLKINLTAAHLDHGLRAESATEAKGCAAFCEILQIPFIEKRIELAQEAKVQGRNPNTGVEEAGRYARWEFYASFQKEYPETIIALGHHNNDLAEDILMRMIRGTGWPGLGGMTAFDSMRGIMRPLLYTTRIDIENFLTNLGISWIEDASNTDTRFLRNRVRHTILPLILQENPAFLESTTGLHRLAEIDAEYFTKQLQNFNLTNTKEIITPKDTLEQLPKALRLRLYKSILDTLGQGQAILKNLLSMDQAWEENPEPTEHLFSGQKRAIIRKRSIVWKISRKNQD